MLAELEPEPLRLHEGLDRLLRTTGQRLSVGHERQEVAGAQPGPRRLPVDESLAHHRDAVLRTTQPRNRPPVQHGRPAEPEVETLLDGVRRGRFGAGRHVGHLVVELAQPQVEAGRERDREGVAEPSGAGDRVVAHGAGSRPVVTEPEDPSAVRQGDDCRVGYVVQLEALPEVDPGQAPVDAYGRGQVLQGVVEVVSPVDLGAAGSPLRRHLERRPSGEVGELQQPIADPERDRVFRTQQVHAVHAVQRLEQRQGVTQGVA